MDGKAGRLGRSSLTVAVYNSGTIESSGLTTNAFTVFLGTGGVNFGTVRANPGSTLALDGPGWTNAPGGTIAATSTTLTTNSGTNTFTNLGTFTAVDSVVDLGGSFTQGSLGNFTRTRGQVTLTGTVAGGLTLDEPPGRG